MEGVNLTTQVNTSNIYIGGLCGENAGLIQGFAQFLKQTKKELFLPRGEAALTAKQTLAEYTRITVVWRDRVQATRQIALGGRNLDTEPGGVYLVGGAAMDLLRRSIENTVGLSLLDPADLLPEAGEQGAVSVSGNIVFFENQANFQPPAEQTA